MVRPPFLTKLYKKTITIGIYYILTLRIILCIITAFEIMEFSLSFIPV